MLLIYECAIYPPSLPHIPVCPSFGSVYNNIWCFKNSVLLLINGACPFDSPATAVQSHIVVCVHLMGSLCFGCGRRLPESSVEILTSLEMQASVVVASPSSEPPAHEIRNSEQKYSEPANRLLLLQHTSHRNSDYFFSLTATANSVGVLI